MPDWLISVLTQFPIVVVIGFVAWYAYRQVKESKDQQIKVGAEALKAAEARHKETAAAAEARHKEAIAAAEKRQVEETKRLEAAHEKQQELLRQAIQAKDGEIGRLKDEILKELRAMGRKVDKLAQKRTGG